MQQTTVRYATLLPFLIALIAACSSNVGTDGTVAGPPTDTTLPATGTCTASAASIRDTVFKTSCDGAGCHGSLSPAAGLNLVDLMPDQLMGKSSALCSGWSLIVPGSPEKSFLYQKLTASMPACGEVMPLGKPLPDASAQCIADWIQGMAASGGCEKCGGSECVAFAADPLHCGACDNACPAGVACDNGTCACPPGTQACGGQCIETTNDPKNCGQCGNACGAGSSCVAGQCSCPSGLTSCAGTCVELASDAKNCGACGTACAASEVCLSGKCASGCGNLMQCGASCVDTTTNLLNCGGCDAPCAPEQSCSAGKCACSNGGQVCGTSCVDTKTDAKNCGQCGMVCGAGESCVAGACACSTSGAVSFKNDVAPILQAACTSAGCHSGMKPKENLALTSAVAYSELVNVTASQCGGARKLVVPGSPSSSYLIQKLLGVGVCTGTQMPKAGQGLPQNQLDLISDWVCSGAPNN